MSGAVTNVAVAKARGGGRTAARAASSLATARDHPQKIGPHGRHQPRNLAEPGTNPRKSKR
jgi:hypothetical protein